MPSADYFAQLGLLVVRDFLDAPSCANYRLEMRSGVLTPATVVESGISLEQESSRKTKWSDVSEQSLSDLNKRLRAVKPGIERYFDLALNDFERPQFLIYEPGDFYRSHTDCDEYSVTPEYIKKRRVSVVIFLNDEKGSAADSYSGGALTFYGLMDDARWKKFGLPIVSEQGMLVAFRSEITHEVTPVTKGERCSIVSWFF